MPWSEENRGVCAVSLPKIIIFLHEECVLKPTDLPSTRIVALHTAPRTVGTAVNTGNTIVREVRVFIKALERVETDEVEVPLIRILLQVADLESDREGSWTC